MNVGELRKKLVGLPDDMPVALEICAEDEDLVQVDLQEADVEARCDEIDRLYLFGDVNEEVMQLRVIEGGKP